jgi:hypothetical protein
MTDLLHPFPGTRSDLAYKFDTVMMGRPTRGSTNRTELINRRPIGRPPVLECASRGAEGRLATIVEVFRLCHPTPSVLAVKHCQTQPQRQSP